MKDPTLKTSRIKIGSITISNIKIQNNQLILHGKYLNQVTSLNIKNNSGLDESFSIESKTGDKLVANGLALIDLGVNSLFNLIISSAAGAATYPIDFTLANGSVTGSKFSQMGAAVGQVLAWDGSVWKPSSAVASNVYLGAWNASTNNPALNSGCNTTGEYYIVSAGDGALNIDNITTAAIGDWILCNGTTWEKIQIASGVTTLAGMSDADITGVAVNQYLKHDGTNWVNGALDESLGILNDVDLAGGIAPNDVLYFNNASSEWEPIDVNSLVTGITDAKITGMAASKLTGALPAIDGSALTNIPSQADATKLPLAGGTLTGDLTMGANNIITTGTVDGVDVSTLSTTVGTNTGNITSNDTDIATNVTGIVTNATAIATNATAIATNVTGIAGNVTALAGKEEALAAGTAAQYYKGDKTWSDFDTSVNASVLTGYLVPGVDPGNIAATDNLLSALEKLEYKIDDDPSGADHLGNHLATQKIDLATYPLVGNGGIEGIIISAGGDVLIKQICDEAGANCKDISTGWAAGGSVTSISSGTGLTGAAITTSGTLNVDVGIIPIQFNNLAVISPFS